MSSPSGCLSAATYFHAKKVLLIHRYRSLLQIGLKIKHAVKDYPAYMVFYPVDVADVVEMEEALDANSLPVAQAV
jgi:hypothetical protein